VTAHSNTSKFNRRSFLHQSAVVAGSVAVSRLIIPSFAGALDMQSPIATTGSGKVRGYVYNSVSVFKGIVN